MYPSIHPLYKYPTTLPLSHHPVVHPSLSIMHSFVLSIMRASIHLSIYCLFIYPSKSPSLSLHPAHGHPSSIYCMNIQHPFIVCSSIHTVQTSSHFLIQSSIYFLFINSAIHPSIALPPAFICSSIPLASSLQSSIHQSSTHCNIMCPLPHPSVKCPLFYLSDHLSIHCLFMHHPSTIHSPIVWLSIH